jgi:hypothetical protein
VLQLQLTFYIFHDEILAIVVLYDGAGDPIFIAWSFCDLFFALRWRKAQQQHSPGVKC